MAVRYWSHLSALSAVFALVGMLVTLSAASTASAQSPTRQSVRAANGKQATRHHRKVHQGRRTHGKIGRGHRIGREFRKAALRRSIRNAVAVTSASPPDLLFKGTHIGDFQMNQSAPGAVTEVADPAGSGESVFKMTVNNKDVAPVTPTGDPRAQLLSPSIIKPGDEFWWSSKFFLPADFPSSVPGWLTVMEGPYGPPFEGTPPWHLEVNGSHIQWSRNGTYGWDVPWQMPLVRGSWVNVLLHDRFGTEGFVEMWINGQQVSFFEPGSYNPNHESETQRLAMKTMDSSNNGGANFAVIQSYRKLGMFESVSLFQGPMEIGKTRASVGG